MQNQRRNLEIKGAYFNDRGYISKYLLMYLSVLSVLNDFFLFFFGSGAAMLSASGTPVKVTPIHMPRHSNSLRRYFLHMYQVSTCGKHERGGSGSDIDSSRWYENVRKSTSPRFGLPSPSLSHTQRGVYLLYSSHSHTMLAT